MKDWKEQYREFDENFKRTQAASDALPDGLQVGKIISFGVADGYAYYEIVKVNKTTVRLQWRGDLSLDSYQDRLLGAGGSVPRNMIEPIVAGEDRLKNILSRPPK